MIVVRRGGTVALKAVSEAIKKVQIGTEKTAAELAIVRYEKELQDVGKRVAELASVKESGGARRCVLGALSTIFGVAG